MSPKTMLGNLVRVLDDQGSVIARYEYDSYGKRTLVQGSPAFNIAYGFTGRYHDSETGLVYFRNRHYSPIQGRFVTQDRIGTWSDLPNLGNGYAYVWNDPMNVVDPLGKEGWLITGLSGGGGKSGLDLMKRNLDALADAAGEGESNFEVVSFSDREKILADIIKFHAKNPKEPIVIVGHSRGATVANWLIWRLQERQKRSKKCMPIRLVVLIDAYWAPTGPINIGGALLPWWIWSTKDLPPSWGGFLPDLIPPNVRNYWEYRTAEGALRDREVDRRAGGDKDRPGDKHEVSKLPHTDIDNALAADAKFLKKLFKLNGGK